MCLIIEEPVRALVHWVPFHSCHNSNLGKPQKEPNVRLSHMYRMSRGGFLDIDSAIDLKIMKVELHNKGSQIPESASYLEVRELYKKLMVGKI